MFRLCITLCAVTTAGVAAAQTYVIDPVHSQPLWETRHIGMGSQHGSFGKLSGKVVLDRAARKGEVDLTIDATSLRSFDSRLDSLLKGDRFFNIEKFPTITFKSTAVNFENDRIASVDGDLTMVGVTRPVSLKVVSFNCGENPFNKKPMCGADAVTVIKRSDWGITTGLNLGNPADEVTLRMPVEAYRE